MYRTVQPIFVIRNLKKTKRYNNIALFFLKNLRLKIRNERTGKYGTVQYGNVLVRFHRAEDFLSRFGFFKILQYRYYVVFVSSILLAYHT